MKKILILLFSIPILFGCDGGSINNNNPNIPNYPVNMPINLNLPEYNDLTYASGHYVNYSQGARGVVVFNTGTGFVAYDLACPNQPYASCASAMTISGIEATCSCDNTVYNLFTAQSPGQAYPLKQYRVDVSGNTLYVYN